jgi:hypothetical protein
MDYNLSNFQRLAAASNFPAERKDLKDAANFNDAE